MANKERFLTRNISHLRRNRYLDRALGRAEMKRRSSQRKVSPSKALDSAGAGTTLRVIKPLKNFRKRGDFKGELYRKMWEMEYEVLEEPRGRAVLRRLGLEGFCFQPVPRLDKRLCDEFLASFDAKSGSGVVRGHVIKLDAETISSATKLPLGADSRLADVDVLPEGVDLALGRLMGAAVNEEKQLGFNLGNVRAVFGVDSDVWIKVAALIMRKLYCRQDQVMYVSRQVILALDRSFRTGIELNWSKHLAKLMIQAAGKSNKCTFLFGEWLTLLILKELGLDDDRAAIVVKHKLESNRLVEPVEKQELEIVRLGELAEKKEVEMRLNKVADEVTDMELVPVNEMVAAGRGLEVFQASEVGVEGTKPESSQVKGVGKSGIELELVRLTEVVEKQRLEIVRLNQVAAEGRDLVSQLLQEIAPSAARSTTTTFIEEE